MPVRFQPAERRRADRGRRRRVRRRRPRDELSGGPHLRGLTAGPEQDDEQRDEPEVADEHEPGRGRVEVQRKPPVAVREPELGEHEAEPRAPSSRRARAGRGRAATSGTSQIRNCGESTLPKATKAHDGGRAGAEEPLRARRGPRANQRQIPNRTATASSVWTIASASGSPPARFCDPWLETIVRCEPADLVRGEQDRRSRGSRSAAAASSGARLLSQTPCGRARRTASTKTATTPRRHARAQTSASRRPRRLQTHATKSGSSTSGKIFAAMPTPSGAEREPVAAGQERRDRRGDERGRPEVEARQHDRAERERRERDERAAATATGRDRPGRARARRRRAPIAAAPQQRHEEPERAVVVGLGGAARDHQRRQREHGQRRRRILDREVAVWDLAVGHRVAVALVDRRVDDQVVGVEPVVQRRPHGREHEHRDERDGRGPRPLSPL